MQYNITNAKRKRQRGGNEEIKRLPVRSSVMIIFSVWLVSIYSHVYIILTVVIVTLPMSTVRIARWRGG